MNDFLINNRGDLILDENPVKSSFRFSFALRPENILRLSFQTDYAPAEQAQVKGLLLTFKTEEEKEHANYLVHKNPTASLQQEILCRLKTERGELPDEEYGSLLYQYKHLDIYDERVLRAIEEEVRRTVDDLFEDLTVQARRADPKSTKGLNQLEIRIYNHEYLISIFTL